MLSLAVTRIRSLSREGSERRNIRAHLSFQNIGVVGCGATQGVEWLLLEINAGDREQ